MFSLIAKGYAHNMLSVVFLFTLRMKRLWVPGFPLALILLPGLAFAQTQQFRFFPEAKKTALPQLSDGLGWKQPMYYATISDRRHRW